MLKFVSPNYKLIKDTRYISQSVNLIYLQVFHASYAQYIFKLSFTNEYIYRVLHRKPK